MGDCPAEIDVCAATRRERDAEVLDLIRPGERLTVLRERSGDGLAFGDYSTGVDCLDWGYRSDLLEMGRECCETCWALGCEGMPPFKVGCAYVCGAWNTESPQAVADMRSQWRREAKVVRMRV